MRSGSTIWHRRVAARRLRTCWEGANLSGLWQSNWTTKPFVAPWWEDAYKLASWARQLRDSEMPESRD